MALIPEGSIAGRALVVVIAILTFLACLTAGGAVLVAEASHAWRADAAHAVTVQVKPHAGEDLEAMVQKAADAVRASPAVESTRVYSAPETAKMLEPWLGAGLDLSRLPIPRLIVAQLRDQSPAALAQLRSTLATAAPSASLDDHQLWLSRLGAMANAIVAFAIALFALVILSMGAAIGFATRGAMAGARDIMEVLHFVGADDRYIAREFGRHFSRLGLHGAAIGGAGAAAFFLVASALSAWWRRSAGGEEIAAMFGAFWLPASGYVALVLVCVGIALLTGALSRATVFRHLRSLS